MRCKLLELPAKRRQARWRGVFGEEFAWMGIEGQDSGRQREILRGLGEP